MEGTAADFARCWYVSAKIISVADERRPAERRRENVSPAGSAPGSPWDVYSGEPVRGGPQDGISVHAWILSDQADLGRIPAELPAFCRCLVEPKSTEKNGRNQDVTGRELVTARQGRFLCTNAGGEPKKIGATSVRPVITPMRRSRDCWTSEPPVHGPLIRWRAGMDRAA